MYGLLEVPAIKILMGELETLMNLQLLYFMTVLDLTLKFWRHFEEKKSIQVCSSTTFYYNSYGSYPRKGIDEDDGTNYYMLVNTSNRIAGGSKDLAFKVTFRTWIR